MSSDTIKNPDSTHNEPEEIMIPLEDIDVLKNKIKRLESERDELKLKAKQTIDFMKKCPVVISIEKYLIMAKDHAIYRKISEANIQLPNASQGKLYQAVFDIEKLGFPEIKYFELKGLKEHGLLYDRNTKAISGTPTQSGEFSIKFRFKFTDKEDNYPLLEKSISLIINPDPRSLWKNEPSDDKDKYWKPDSAKTALSIEGNKKIIVASQRGRSHAQEGKFRDDHFAVYHNEVSKWSVVVVADGAGSAKYSRQGSLLACNEVVNYFKELTEEQTHKLETVIAEFRASDFDNQAKKNLDDLLYKQLAGVAFDAYKKIEQEAIKNEAMPKDYATTLVFSILKKYDFGWFIASYGVGDSPMGVYTINQTPIVMHQPEEGEYSGQTYFLTMAEVFKDSNAIAERIKFEIVEDFTAVILMTDGIYDPKFQTRTNLGKTELWAALWSDLKEQVDFSLENEELANGLLRWLDFWSQGNHDDRTIALIF
jgi:serine/threonine protein phosphatase PrpC